MPGESSNMHQLPLIWLILGQWPVSHEREHPISMMLNSMPNGVPLLCGSCRRACNERARMRGGQEEASERDTYGHTTGAICAKVPKTPKKVTDV